MEFIYVSWTFNAELSFDNCSFGLEPSPPPHPHPKKQLTRLEETGMMNQVPCIQS